MTFLKLNIVFCFLGVSTLFAQDALVTSAGEVKTSGGELSYSVGQLFVNTNSGSERSIQEGIHQPFEISHVVGLSEHVHIKLDASVYPNPTTSTLSLKIPISNYANLTYQLVDIHGKELTMNKVISDKSEINVESYSSGMYFLNVFENKRLLKSFKVRITFNL